MEIAGISYTRPSEPATKEDIDNLLNLGGKDIIRLAWTSLSPDSSGALDARHLEAWLHSFFNLRSRKEGYRCVRHIPDIGLLQCSRNDYYYNDYKGYYFLTPSFEL